jgi:hypothetical protein
MEDRIGHWILNRPLRKKCRDLALLSLYKGSG